MGEPAAQSVIITLAWSLALVLLFGPLTLRAYKRKNLNYVRYKETTFLLPRSCCPTSAALLLLP